MRPMGVEKENYFLSLCLAGVSFLTLREKNILLKNLDSAAALALLSIDDIATLVGRTFRAAVWNGPSCVREAEKAERIIKAFGIETILNGEALYPALLAEAENAPFMLFCRGDVSCLSGETVSVVGTRRMTREGKEAAFSFARDAARNGVTVVSGLAYGIDASAHAGAVDACFDAMEAGTEKNCGKTAAILPCGADMIVPSSHKRLAEKIIKTGGVLVSEYLPGVPAEAWRFVHRNRIIAALSPATVVVESPPGSGALITAQYALDYNRDVMIHEAAFSAPAKAVSRQAKCELEKKIERGEAAKGKTERTAEKYVADGAPVIKDYADYRRCRSEAPGTRSGEPALF